MQQEEKKTKKKEENRFCKSPISHKKMNQKKAPMTERLQQWKVKKQTTKQPQSIKTPQIKGRNEPKSTVEKENGQRRTIQSNVSKKIVRPENEPKLSARKVVAQNENVGKPAINRREQLEKWRQEKGKNMPDTASNKLLSRKRPLIGYDSKPVYPKKPKRNAAVNEGKKDKEYVKDKNEKINEIEENGGLQIEKTDFMKEVAVCDQEMHKTDESHESERVPSYTPMTNSNKATPSKYKTPQKSTNTSHGTTKVLKSAMVKRNMATPRDRKTISFTPYPNGTPSSVIKDGVLRNTTGTPDVKTPRDRKTISFTPNQKSASSTDKNSVIRSGPNRRSVSTIKCLHTPFTNLNTPKDRQTTNITPLKKFTALSARKGSILRSAPQRRSLSTTQFQEKQFTPFSKMRNLPDKSILKSAPARRSISTLKMQQMKKESQSARKSILHQEPRRRTIATVPGDGTPNVIAPFTPRAEWNNENLTIRERLDIWLSVRGRTVTKPYVIIKQTPRSKKTASGSPTNADDVQDELNRTFTFEEESFEEPNESGTTQKFPKMNEIERKVVEESLEQILIKINEVSELDTLKDELDLILSTSPGVVRLAQYWIARARLAATNESIERVICLLEQANAFEAEPEEIIRDEICQYLEKLKTEEIHTKDEANDVETGDDQLIKPGRTPAKRVKFMDTQRHLAFNSSLIRFCLLECTPFRKRLKSTLAKQILTPVRRSGRIERSESRLPSVVRSHVRTVSSPSEVSNGTKNGDIFYLPNLNVESKWNEIWEEKGGKEDQVSHEVSF